MEQVTVEHISVIQERLGRTMEIVYPGEDTYDIITRNFDPTKMREEILELFTTDAFMRLFPTEIGKGVIMGAFLQRYILNLNVEE